MIVEYTVQSVHINKLTFNSGVYYKNLGHTSEYQIFTYSTLLVICELF